MQESACRKEAERRKTSQKGFKRVSHPKGTYAEVASSGGGCSPLVSPGVHMGEGETHMEWCASWMDTMSL